MSIRGSLAVGALAGSILASAALAADSKSPTQAYMDYLDRSGKPRRSPTSCRTFRRSIAACSKRAPRRTTRSGSPA